jgi:hypothetical protein
MSDERVIWRGSEQAGAQKHPLAKRAVSRPLDELDTLLEAMRAIEVVGPV